MLTILIFFYKVIDTEISKKAALQRKSKMLRFWQGKELGKNNC